VASLLEQSDVLDEHEIFMLFLSIIEKILKNAKITVLSTFNSSVVRVGQGNHDHDFDVA
jgi:hypothetical protein